MPILWKAIIIIASTALIGGSTIGIVAYQTRYTRELTLQVSVPQSAIVGIPFDAGISVSNISKEDFNDVQIILSLPDGMAFVGSPSEQTSDVRSLSNLAAGGVSTQNFKVIALSNPNTFQQITAIVSRAPGSISPKFEKKATANIQLGGYAIGLDLAAPQQVFNGESLDAEISIKNLSDIDFSNLQLRLDYPQAFSFTRSNVAPDIGNTNWFIENLPRGAEKKFKVTGNLLGQEGASFDMRAGLDAIIAGNFYQINSNSAALSIAPSPVTFRVTRSGDDQPVQPGERLSYALSYTNNTDIALRDVVIEAKLTGAMFDLASLNTTGSFRSSGNTISWNASNSSGLRTIPPGQSGLVTFDLRTKSDYPIKKIADKNFTLKVDAKIDSPSVPYAIEQGNSAAFANTESKVQGRVLIDARGYFRDAISGIANKGSMPLRLNQPTDFTIHWLIANYANDISDVEVHAFLGGNIRFTGKVKSNTLTIPTYNERTQEMTWTIPKISANAGVIGKPIEAIFQIEAMPSTNDLNRDMLLIQPTSLTGTDDFTGVAISANDIEISTQLPDDPTLAGARGPVHLQSQAEQLQQQQMTEREKLLKLLQDQQVSQAEQDQQLGQLEQQQGFDWAALQRQLEKQYADLLNQQNIDLSNDMINASQNAADNQACIQDALDKRDAEVKAVDENRSDDLRSAADKRKKLLIAAALVGDPHLRHIAIIAAIIGYQKDEKEIQDSWNKGRAEAEQRYQQDVAECNSTGTVGQ